MERAVFRIIDANFNRAREAVRFIEDFCRFCLNCEQLSSRAKVLRHRLCAVIEKLDIGRLIASRDTPGDVGTTIRINNQLQRNNLNDSLSAACKRFTEALRCLSEAAQILNTTAAHEIEKIRYEAYTLEKDVLIQNKVGERFRKVRLYVIISDSFAGDIISLVQACIAGGADCLQLRAKNMSDAQLFALAAGFVRICKKASVLSVINDRLDIALCAGADGIHLGQDDLGTNQARQLQLEPLIIGKSTHSLSQLRKALQEQPTYVSLGPVFATDTKPGTAEVGLGYVKESLGLLSGVEIHHVAIGGINLRNIDQVLHAGARTVAVCSAVCDAPKPEQMCRRLKERILAH